MIIMFLLVNTIYYKMYSL